MVPDPYKTLGVEHDASLAEIKKAYRKLAMQLHPDRLTRLGADEAEIKAATGKFAAVTAAHAILKDPLKKSQYDHIFKYGGYDEIKEKMSPRNQSSPRHGPAQKGIGFSFVDPVSYVISRGKVKETTVAGLSVPRFSMRGAPSGGFKVSISKGKREESETGSIHCRSTTLQFAAGKKESTVETTTIHRDGRKEVVIEGEDYIERHYSMTTRRKKQPTTISEESEGGCEDDDGENQAPWHAQVMNDISSNFKKCVGPAAEDPWNSPALKEIGKNLHKCVNPDLGEFLTAHGG